jgi:hypothetical protein
MYQGTTSVVPNREPENMGFLGPESNTANRIELVNEFLIQP